MVLFENLQPSGTILQVACLLFYPSHVKNSDWLIHEVNYITKNFY